MFERSILHLPGGDFTINAPNTTDANRYVASATLDGQRIDSPFLNWQQLLGKTLTLVMTDKPINLS